MKNRVKNGKILVQLIFFGTFVLLPRVPMREKSETTQSGITRKILYSCKDPSYSILLAF